MMIMVMMVTMVECRAGVLHKDDLEAANEAEL